MPRSAFSVLVCPVSPARFSPEAWLAIPESSSFCPRPAAVRAIRPRRERSFAFYATADDSGSLSPATTFETGSLVWYKDKWGDQLAGVVMSRNSKNAVEVKPLEGKSERSVWVDEGALQPWEATGERVRDEDVEWRARAFRPYEAGAVSEEERERALAEYERLKGGVLRDAALLALAGTAAAGALGGPRQALPYLVGGLAGLMYLWAVARKAEQVAEGKPALLPIPLLVAAPFAALLALARQSGLEGPALLESLAPALLGFFAHKLPLFLRVTADAGRK
eukprot:tig00001154_g7293.t1